MSPYTLAFLSLVTILADPVAGHAANPLAIEWQKSFGGFGIDAGCVVKPVVNGFVVSGASGSIGGGNKTAPNLGSHDYWCLRLDTKGEIVWQQTFGGDDLELAYDLLAYPDGGCIVVGNSFSRWGGNKATNGTGTWLVRLDPAGTKLWETIGGGESPTIAPLSDGGFIVESQVIHRGNPRRVDTYLMRFQADSSHVWTRSFTGNTEFNAECVQQTRDGGFILAGGAKSPSTFGEHDYWVIHLNGLGNPIWSRTFGGTNDEVVKVVFETVDGFILAGTSASGINGNKATANFGSNDFWIVNLDSMGNKVGEYSYGGSDAELLTSAILFPDGSLVLAGGSMSGVDGNKTAPAFGGWDGWVVRVDAHGSKLWDQSFGAGDLDGINSISSTADGGFILGLDTLSSVGGNKTTPLIGLADYWVIKVLPEPPHLRWEPCCFGSNGPQWKLMLSGISNALYRTEVSTNLLDWAGYRTNRVGGRPVEIFRSNLRPESKRFYRSRTLQAGAL